jgi:hypothetical protein
MLGNGILTSSEYKAQRGLKFGDNKSVCSAPEAILDCDTFENVLSLGAAILKIEANVTVISFVLTKNCRVSLT